MSKKFVIVRLFQNAKIQDLNVIHNYPKYEMNQIKLFQNAKIQDLNVIHNKGNRGTEETPVVSECKDTRFECNSQHYGALRNQSQGCFRMQRYKI